LCGAAGCGKTLFSIQYLVRGALDDGEPGVFVAFEETEEDITKNVASLGFDLRDLEKRKLLAIDHIRVERSEIEENGEYDLEGLFIRLSAALESVGAKRLVIDTLETVFGGLSSYGIIRSELRRLFAWLKERGITTILTAERGEGTLTRHGLEEYVSDCVVLLDHRVRDQISTRRLRVVKYRGSTHGSNEYPFLIDDHGLTVVPITTADLQHQVSNERVDTGIEGLNEMLQGPGYYRGSTILVTGTAGCGKSSLSAHFIAAACARGERSIYVSYEESEQQIIRNMKSIGLELEKHVKQGILRIIAHRPTSFGLEGHLAVLHKLVSEYSPANIVIDPISTMSSGTEAYDAHLMLVRMIDFFKNRGITVMLTNLTSGGGALEATDVQVSSLVDTWIMVRADENNGERTRALYVLKSRGMSHSQQLREFRITGHGIVLIEPYVGSAGVLTGTARMIQESAERRKARERGEEMARARRLIDTKREVLGRRIATLEAEFGADLIEYEASVQSAVNYDDELQEGRALMDQARGGASLRKRATQVSSNGQVTHKKSPSPRRRSV
jgi:circadian clock protein KaiC